MSHSNGFVYVVDDDESVREGVADLVSSAGLTARTASSGREFMAMERPDVPSCLILDVNLPELSGIELQQELVRCGVQIPIIFLTGHGDIPMTVRALKAGAADFLTKPVHDEELLKAIRQCIARDRTAARNLHDVQNSSAIQANYLQDRRLYMESEPGIAINCKVLHKARLGALAVPKGEQLCLETEISTEDCFEGIVGKSAALRKVLEQVAIVAPTDSTVLLHGETGTGKELFARAIHNLSSRRERAFVRMNCAAIPSGLLESELFGHEKGAFTGALIQRKGRFELADGGSLFLDEIGDIGLELQPKLLRAVQEQEFERLGSSRTIQVNVRLIAATHRDLEAMIKEEKFRQDLFYRFNVFPIEIPPLRERREDIPLLVNYFVSEVCRRIRKQITSIPRQAMECLTNCSWSGNVRELANFIERAVILSRGEELEVPIAELCSPSEVAFAAAPSTFRRAECSVIVDALRAASGRIAGKGGAAERLGLKRTTLQNKIRRLGITKAQVN